jgi:hypothetical protein
MGFQHTSGKSGCGLFGSIDLLLAGFLFFRRRFLGTTVVVSDLRSLCGV